MAEGFRGNIAQISLLDILRMLTSGRRSGKLELQHAGKSGEIYLDRGIIVHAVSGAQMGERVV